MRTWQEERRRIKEGRRSSTFGNIEKPNYLVGKAMKQPAVCFYRKSFLPIKQSHQKCLGPSPNSSHQNSAPNSANSLLRIRMSRGYSSVASMLQVAKRRLSLLGVDPFIPPKMGTKWHKMIECDRSTCVSALLWGHRVMSHVLLGTLLRVERGRGQPVWRE